MAISKNIIVFLTSFSLFYNIQCDVTAAPSPAPPSTVAPLPAIDVSCPSPGTVNVNVRKGTFGSVLVECEYEGSNTVRTILGNGTTGSIIVPNCTINKPVKLVLFNGIHEKLLKAVIKENDSKVFQEIIVVCNGSHLTVNQNFTNSVLVSTNRTNIPLQNALTMQVTQSGSETGTQHVDIANNYQLLITGPENMFLLVESCDAASDSNFKNDLVPLYVERKPNADYGVLKTFSNNTASKTEASMVGFRLVDSTVVYLRCVVDICNVAGCPSLTTTTNPPQGGSKRRRRNVDTTNRRVTLSTSFRVKPLFTSTSGVNGSTIGDRRYAFIASLLVAKYFLFSR